MNFPHDFEDFFFLFVFFCCSLEMRQKVQGGVKRERLRDSWKRELWENIYLIYDKLSKNVLCSKRWM